VAPLSLLHISVLSQKRQDFLGEGNYWTWDICLDFLYNILFKIYLIIRIIKRNMNINMICCHVKYPFFLLDFNHTWIFTRDFQKMLNIIFHENPSSGSRVDWWGRTGVTNLIVDFHNFPNAPNQDIPERKQHFCYHRCAPTGLEDRSRRFLRTLLPTH
jgi:hypothetical protein